MKLNIFWALGCICLLAACSKQPKEVVSVQKIQSQLGCAKHFDIPVPISFSLATTSSQKQTLGFCDFMKYTGSLPVHDVIKFYVREMERNSWEITNLSSTHEGFLYCSKPTKLCGIQVRPHEFAHKNNTTTLCIFVTHT